VAPSGGESWRPLVQGVRKLATTMSAVADEGRKEGNATKRVVLVLVMVAVMVAMLCTKETGGT
jgi:hypothetical protein